MFALFELMIDIFFSEIAACIYEKNQIIKII